MQYHEIKQFARKLRKAQTEAEEILWAEVRNRRLDGKKFVRQFPIKYESIRNEHFFFIADFYCHEYKLVIELDGPVHLTQTERDQNRDAILQSLGLKVLRIKNEELIEIEKVKNKIREYLN